MANDTRCNGDLAAISRALDLREPLEDYIALEIRKSRADEDELVHDQLSTDDWTDLHFIQEILEPFRKWSILLQGKGGACLHEIIPAFDELLSHLEQQRIYQKSLPESSPFITTSINNAWQKMNKYYSLLDDSPAYFAAVALHPDMRFEYFENEWEEKPEWIRKAKEMTRTVWERDYKGSSNSMGPGAASGSSDFDVSVPVWRQRKRARLESDTLDPFEKFQQSSVPDISTTGVLEHWEAVSKGNAASRTLAKMGLEMASIPAMSSEPERVFSSGRYTISSQRARLGDDIVEAIECLKSWSRDDLVFTEKSQVGTTEKMLVALLKQADTEDGGYTARPTEL